jgi:hypothetical protein
MGVFCGEAAMLYLVARGILVVSSSKRPWWWSVCLSTSPDERARGVALATLGLWRNQPHFRASLKLPTLGTTSKIQKGNQFMLACHICASTSL